VQALNYLSLRQGSEDGVQKAIDNYRVSASKTSPAMEIIQVCMVQVGTEELPSFVPRLLEVMKKGVGVATKVTAIQLVITLVSQSREDLTPYASKGWCFFVLFVCVCVCVCTSIQFCYIRIFCVY